MAAVGQSTRAQYNTYPFPAAPVETVEELDRVVSLPGTREVVERQVNKYQTINIAEAMEALTQVGSLLRLANASSQGFPCSEKIMPIMTAYQKLLCDSLLTCSSFTASSFSALDNHAVALKLIEADKASSAMEMIGACRELACKMAEESRKLADCADRLSGDAGDALLIATKDKNITLAQQGKIDEMMTTLKARKAKLEQLYSDISKHAEEERELERKALEGMQGERKWLFLAAAGAALMKPLTIVASTIAKLGPGKGEELAQELSESVREVLSQGVEKLGEIREKLAIKRVELRRADEAKKVDLEKDIAGLEAQEKTLFETQERNRVLARTYAEQAAAATRRRAELQREQRAANAELAESVALLRDHGVEKNKLSTAVQALGLTVRTLGKIHTIFTGTRAFWMILDQHCSYLIEQSKRMSALADAQLKDAFFEKVKQSGLCWLAIAKINRTATLRIGEAKHQFDHTMSNLPVGDEVTRIVSEAIKELNKQLEAERLLLEQ